MQKYNALTPEQKQQINNCFDDGDADVFSDNVNVVNAWLGECDEDEIVTAKDKVDKVLASF